jgi:hypothetical protein
MLQQITAVTAYRRGDALRFITVANSYLLPKKSTVKTAFKVSVCNLPSASFISYLILEHIQILLEAKGLFFRS